MEEEVHRRGESITDVGITHGGWLWPWWDGRPCSWELEEAGRVQQHLGSVTWKIPTVCPGARVRLAWGIGVGREAGVSLWAGSSPHVWACHVLARGARKKESIYATDSVKYVRSGLRRPVENFAVGS